jgi:glycosyltransferase involved in cell wall biosynthesis
MSPSTIHNQEVDILIVDDAFPHPYSAFRMQEFVSYLGEFEKLKIFSSGSSIPLLGSESLAQLVADFRNRYPEYADKIGILRPNASLQARLMYMVFLGNAYEQISTIEKAGIPFVFTLYPGGWFRLHNTRSDGMLKRVTGSACFRKVIVTQKITHDYLLEKRLCTPDQIEFIFGVVIPVKQMHTEYTGKSHFGYEKNVLDICFVAHRYTKKGLEKGYDVFIEVARELCRKSKNIHFHVVGGFDETIFDVSAFRERITFYGKRDMAWFDEFYKDKDIILSPNIPSKISEGAFDGFPTGACVDAGLRQTALFCTDELKQNTHFVDGAQIVIIPHDAAQVANIIEDYYRDPQKLRVLAENGCRRIREVYSFEAQILPRINLLKKELEQMQVSKKVVFQPVTTELSFRQRVELLALSMLTTAKRVSPTWFKNLLKKADRKIRSNRVIFNFIKRFTPEFVLRIYLRLRGLP